MTYRDYISIEKHALTLFTSAFLSPYDELFNIKQNFKMKKYMPLNGLRWSRDSGSALCGTPPTDVLGQAGGGIKTEKQASAFPDVITRFERQSVLSLFNF